MTRHFPTKKKKKPWPTKDAMTQVYTMKLWGGNDFDFYSGEGSHDKKIITPYLKAVITFLNSFTSKLIVCDIGCGDFNIGKELFIHTEKYIAIDIVEDLIIRNKKQFKANNLEFECLNIVADTLPKGDCVILRQVLQHLSNKEVKQIVDKLDHFKYLILTEHIPFTEFEANKDIISGQGIRLKKHSGIDLLKDPFNLNIKEKKKLCEHTLDNNKGIIVTHLFHLR